MTGCISALDVFLTSQCCVEWKRNLKELVTWLCRYSWRYSLSTEGGNCKYGMGKFKQWSSKGWQCWHCTEYSIIHGIFIFFLFYWAPCEKFQGKLPFSEWITFVLAWSVPNIWNTQAALQKILFKMNQTQIFCNVAETASFLYSWNHIIGYLIVSRRTKNKFI